MPERKARPADMRWLPVAAIAIAIAVLLVWMFVTLDRDQALVPAGNDENATYGTNRGNDAPGAPPRGGATPDPGAGGR